MERYERLQKLSAETFKRLTGVKPDTFKAMFKECELADKVKKRRGGKPNKLSISTQILLMLEYYREYRSMAHMAFDYEVSEATVSRTIFNGLCKKSNKDLMKVALRQNAIVIFDEDKVTENTHLNATSSVLVANVADLGFGFSEELLQAINQTTLKNKQKILALLQEVMGTDKNWTPLVKGWNVPTNENVIDHLMTFFANTFKSKKGTRLACEHIIPENTFPLERYNGCPYCGQAIEKSDEIFYGKGSKLKVLELWGDTELQAHYLALLNSKTALDATQIESLKIFLMAYPLPSKVSIEMKETLMLVLDILVENEKHDEAGKLFKTPQDIMRYLWFKQTEFLQIVEPKTVIKRKAINQMGYANHSESDLLLKQANIPQELKLKYSRKECKMLVN